MHLAQISRSLWRPSLVLLVFAVSATPWTGHTEPGPTTALRERVTLEAPEAAAFEAGKRLAEWVVWEYLITLPAPCEVVAPEPRTLVIGRAQAGTLEREVIHSDGQWRSERFRLSLRAFFAGRHYATGLRFEVRCPNEEVLTLNPPLASLWIPLWRDEIDPEALAHPHSLAVWVRDWRWLWWSAALLSAFTLLGGLWRWRRRSLNQPKELPPPLPAGIRALARLDALEPRACEDQDQLQALVYLLSEITRAYLGERFSFAGLELTSRELMQWMAVVERPAALQVEALAAFLQGCDQVKYARQPATPEDADFLIQQARALILQAEERPLRHAQEESHGGA